MEDTVPSGAFLCTSAICLLMPSEQSIPKICLGWQVWIFWEQPRSFGIALLSEALHPLPPTHMNCDEMLFFSGAMLSIAQVQGMLTIALHLPGLSTMS